MVGAAWSGWRALRVVSLAPAATEALVRIGAGDELVGVSAYCRPWLDEPKPVVGGYVKASLRLVKRLEPDVVLLQGPAQLGLYEEMRRAGLPARLLPLPATLEGVADLVVQVGALVGRLAEARALAGELASRAAELKASRRELGIRLAVAYLWGDGSVNLGGPGTIADELIYVAGAENPVREPGFAPAGPDDLRGLGAHAVAVNVPEELPPRRALALVGRLAEAAGLPRRCVAAVREARAPNLAHPGPSLVDTAAWFRGLARALARACGPGRG